MQINSSDERSRRRRPENAEGDERAAAGASPPPRSERSDQTDWRYRPVSSLLCCSSPTGFRAATRSRVRARAASRTQTWCARSGRMMPAQPRPWSADSAHLRWGRTPPRGAAGPAPGGPCRAVKCRQRRPVRGERARLPRAEPTGSLSPPDELRVRRSLCVPREALAAARSF